MDDKEIKTALAAVGAELGVGKVIELLIVGGAAGLLNGELTGAYTTSDVDAMNVFPPNAWDQLQDAAAVVGLAMGLPANWLNSDARLFAASLPNDWKDRRIDGGLFGRLQVWIVGRLDLIAMKFYSHRPQDREHLLHMKVTASEREFVRQYLDILETTTSPADRGKIELSRKYLDDLG